MLLWILVQAFRLFMQICVRVSARLKFLTLVLHRAMLKESYCNLQRSLQFEYLQMEAVITFPVQCLLRRHTNSFWGGTFYLRRPLSFPTIYRPSNSRLPTSPALMMNSRLGW